MNSIEPIRLLQIVAAPTANESGEIGVNGPERRSGNMVTQWESKGISINIGYPKRGHLWNTFCSSKINLIDFEVTGKFNWSSIISIYKIIKKNKIEILHTQGPGSLDLWAAIAAKLARIKFVFTRPVMLSDLVLISRINRNVYELFDIITCLIADKIIAVSKTGEKRLSSKWYVPKSKIQLIYNGIKINKKKPITETVQTGPFIFGMAAQLTGNKGWYDYIKIVKQVSLEIDVIAYIIGGGPLYTELKEQTIELGIEKQIIFTGHIEHVPNFLKKLNLFIFTSYREGLSVAILEAMAVGLPIICTDIGGSKEQVIEGENGYVLNTGDIHGFSKAIIKLANNREALKNFGDKSYQFAKNKYSQTAMLDGYANLFRNI